MKQSRIQANILLFLTATFAAACTGGADPAETVGVAPQSDGVASCSDGQIDGSETGVDCGGGVCPPCARGQTCDVGTDCKSGACNHGTCAPTVRGLFFPLSLGKYDPTKPKDVNDFTTALATADGVYLSVDWVDVQPTSAPPDFTKLKSLMDQANMQGKKVSISIKAGDGTPQWVFDQGAVSLPQTKIDQPRRTDFCTPVTIPVPWDPVFKTSFENLVAEMGAQVGAYPNLVLVKLTGINYQSDELQLPAGRATLKPIVLSLSDYDDTSQQQLVPVTNPDGSTTYACPLPDYDSQWLAQGYTPSRLDCTFKELLATFRAAFPGMPIAPMFGSLPSIDGAGTLLCSANDRQCQDDNSDAQDLQLIADGSGAFGAPGPGNGFIAQANSLKAGFVRSILLDYRDVYGGRIGVQAAWHVACDNLCLMDYDNLGNCTPKPKSQVTCPYGAYSPDGANETITGALSSGINDAGAAYVEMLETDVDTFGSQMAAASTQLDYEDSQQYAPALSFIQVSGATRDVLDFSHVLPGSPAAVKTLTITNQGTNLVVYPPHITATVQGGACDPFSVADNDCPSTLPSGGTCHIHVSFLPSAAAPASCVLDIPSNDPITPHKRVSLTGDGCSAGEWCEQSPPVQGSTLDAVWGSSATDAWTVGDDGIPRHWDGTAWSAVPGGNGTILMGVWGSSATNAWAVGFGGTILHWTGTSSWSSPVPSGTSQPLTAVWGSSANDVWAVGYGGAIVHYDGTGWSAVTPSPTTQSLYGVWGTSMNDVWAVGNGGTILHKDGTGWSIAQSSGSPNLSGVWGTSTGNVWAVGYGGAILHYNGTAWTSVTSPTTTPLFKVWGSSATDVWAVGDSIQHWDGTAWSTVEEAAFNPLLGVWGSSSGDVWAVGGQGVIQRWDGVAWSPVGSNLSGVWGSSSSSAWAVGKDGKILTWNGTAWSFETSSTQPLNAVWGSSASDVWAAGNQGTLLHRTASGWGPASSGTTAHLYGVWGASGTNLWVVGANGTSRHSSDGVNWTSRSTKTTQTLRSVWGNAGSNVWAVGDQGTILHWGGLSWAPDASKPTTQALNGVWVNTAGDVWAVGANGTILHRSPDTGSWSAEISNTTQVLNGVWGNTLGDVWAVGANGTTLHRPAGSATWSSVASGTTRALDGVWGSTTGDVWVVGQLGEILHTHP